MHTRILLLALALTACGTNATQPALGENFEMRLGEVVQIPDDTVKVTFTDVTADSRCPTSVQCVWAGEAVTLFTVGANEQHTLTLGADATKASVIVRGHKVTLIALKPYPTSTGAPIKSDYVATLRVTNAND